MIIKKILEDLQKKTKDEYKKLFKQIIEQLSEEFVTRIEKIVMKIIEQLPEDLKKEIPDLIKMIKNLMEGIWEMERDQNHFLRNIYKFQYLIESID